MTNSPSSPRSPIYAIYVSCVAALGGLLFGYDTAVIAGTVEFLQKRFQLSDLELGWTVSSALIGCVLGAWLVGAMADRIGRKKSLLVCAALFFISAVWSAIPSSAGELALARIVGGIGVGAASMLTPVYISEISPARMRGALTTLNQGAVLVGMVLVYVVNARLAMTGDEAWRVATAWRWMFGSEALPAAIFFALLFFIPESPRWLAIKGRMSEALRILDKTGDPGKMESLARTNESRGRFSECCRPPLLKIFLMGAGLAILQQITGINIVMYYAPRIFTSAGIETAAAIGHSVIIGLIMLLFTLAAMFFADKAGRRPLLLISALGMTAGLFGLGWAYNQAGSGGSPSALLFWVLLYVAAFSIGMGPLVWTVIGEIFPNRIRTQAASACVLLLWLANFAVSQFFPWLLHAFEHKVFWLFGVICLFAAGFIWLLVPETKGKSLEDLERFIH